VIARPFANHWLKIAVAWELVLLCVVIYVPWLQEPLGTISLTLRDWLLVAVTAVTVVPLLEAVKWMERREWFGELA
jgi:Ca2+-transporting ATPase